MNLPSLEQLDDIRKQGFRPQVVGCFLHEKKLLFFFKNEYDLWQLPQGGIENGETIEEAFTREMTEELGEKFMKLANKKIEIIGEDQILFPVTTQGAKDLKTDDGREIFMKGKKYFFIVASIKKPEINIKETEFDNSQWTSYKEGLDLADTIYQRGKQRITMKALDLLKESKLIQ